MDRKVNNEVTQETSENWEGLKNIGGISPKILHRDLDSLLSFYINLAQIVLNNPQKQDPVKSDLMTRYEVMQYFNISAPTIQRWVKKGTLNKIKVGRKVFFRRSEITNR